MACALTVTARARLVTISVPFPSGSRAHASCRENYLRARKNDLLIERPTFSSSKGRGGGPVKGGIGDGARKADVLSCCALLSAELNCGLIGPVRWSETWLKNTVPADLLWKKNAVRLI